MSRDVVAPTRPNANPAASTPTATSVDMNSARPGIATHYQRYATSSVLAILAGLISFPILTRQLSNTEYGILGYYDTWVLMAIAVGKLGSQHALQRFYPHDGDATRMRAFSTNLFYMPLAISLAMWVLVSLVLITLNWTGGFQQTPVFWLALIGTPLFVFTSLVDTVLRVRERSHLVMYSRIGWRWTELLLMVGAVVLLQQSAVAAYGGKLAAAILAIGFYLYWMRRHLVFSRQAIDFSATREGLIYGLPLVANEIIAVALVTLDRSMLKHMTGDFAPVGVYAIGSSLAMQVSVFMSLAVFEAFTPMANRLYATDGAAGVRALKARILLPMTYAAVLASALLWCFGTDVIIALSGNNKAASGPVFAWMGVINCMQPVLLLAGYGLLLERRTTKVLVLMCATLLINAALNLLWIPSYGVMGAVYATAVSSAGLAIAHCLWVPRALLMLPDLRTLLTAGSVALLCVGGVWASQLFGLRPGWERLLIGGALLGSVYGFTILALDTRLRRMLLERFRPLASRFGGG